MLKRMNRIQALMYRDDCMRYMAMGGSVNWIQLTIANIVINFTDKQGLPKPKPTRTLQGPY